MKLLRCGQPVATLFDLLGNKENDMTAGLAYTLAASPCFLERMVNRIAEVTPATITEAIIKIQTGRCHEGITDIEIIVGNEVFIVIEAKRGTILPSGKQLKKYIPIVQKHKAKVRLLVTVSNSTQEVAAVHYGAATNLGIPIIHVAWREIEQMARRAMPDETNANKQLLKQFTAYLGELLGMENKYSNLVYVVSLSAASRDGWPLSFIEVVEKCNRYFYPVGNGWPDPPNYLGFRYSGKLQSIRWVESFVVSMNPHEEFPEVSETKWDPHYVLRLGPPIIPMHEVRNGPSIVRAARCWCMIDALLTSQTISDALSETKKREAEDAQLLHS